MEKLTKDDIQFIDNYLIKSEVVYKDIRIEMIDHIATALEARMQSENVSFYDAFKAYMIENKAMLLKENLKNEKQALKRFWKTYLIKAFTIKSLVCLSLIGIIMFVISKYDKSLSTSEAVRNVFEMLIYAVCVYYVIRVRIFTKDKFSSLFYSILFLYAAHILLKLLIGFIVFNEFSGIVTATIVSFLLLHFAITSEYFLNYYKTKYNPI